jgi:hypothetical protein
MGPAAQTVKPPTARQVGVRSRLRGWGSGLAWAVGVRSRFASRSARSAGTGVAEFVTMTSPTDPTRRRLLQSLAVLGITGPLALEVAAQPGARISSDTLRRAAAILGEEFSDERLAVIEKALQRSLDQFQVVRELVIDDRVEPAPLFAARISHGRR